MPRNCESEFARRGSTDNSSVRRGRKGKEMDLNEYLNYQTDQQWYDLATDEEDDFSRITIHEPIWKTLSVGISEALVKNKSGVLVEISYRDEAGRRLWPGQYYISRERMLEFPVKQWRSVNLRIVPIADLKLWKQ